jgi:hypothetical protein
MKAFLDTSSVLKLYHQEDGTEALITSLSQGIQTVCLSELAVLEFRSAVWKKTRTCEIDTVVAKQVIAGFQRDFVKFQWIPLESRLLYLYCTPESLTLPPNSLERNKNYCEPAFLNLRGLGKLCCEPIYLTIN